MNVTRSLFSFVIITPLITILACMQPAEAFVVAKEVPASKVEMNLILPVEQIDTIGLGVTSWNALARDALARWNDVGIGPLPDHTFFSTRDVALSRDSCVRYGINSIDFKEQPCKDLGLGEHARHHHQSFYHGRPSV
jgi:hypothetical protein